MERKTGFRSGICLLNMKQQKRFEMLCWFHCSSNQNVPSFSVHQTDATGKLMFFA